MIYGIGTDIIKIERIKDMYEKYADKFYRKILSSEEAEIFEAFSVDSRKISYLAKRFAAKEAFVKALGTGFRDDITFTAISVYNNRLGRPHLKISQAIRDRLPDHAKLHVSLSDEVDNVMAFVIIEV